MVEFPPPASGGGAAGVEPAYPSAPERPGFVFPPPRQSSGSVRDAGRYVGEKLRETADKADWAANEVNNVGAVVEDYGPQITDLIENRVVPWAVPTIAPLSQTINRRADATFQLSDFMIPPVQNSSGATGLQAGGNTKGRVYITFLTPAITRAYEQLDFMVSEEPDPCRMDIGVYLVNPDTRVLTRQVVQENVTIPVGESVATVRFDRPMVAVQGSYIAVAWLQHGSGNSRFLLGLNDTPRPLTNLVFPRKISAIHTGTGLGALPTTIDGTSQADFGFWFTPYAELSESLGERLQSFTETWPDVGEAPRPWVHLTSPGIRSSGGYTAAGGVGTRVSVYDTPMATDRVQITSSIYRVFNTNNWRSTLIVRATSNLRSGVGLSAVNFDPIVGGAKYELIEWSNVDVGSNWNSRTVVQTINRRPSVGDRLEVDYIDGQVTVRINGQVEVNARAVNGPAGPSGRFVGIQNHRTSDWLFGGFPSPWFGPWTARDLPPSGGDDDDEDGE